jgi:hypothetical protein
MYSEPLITNASPPGVDLKAPMGLAMRPCEAVDNQIHDLNARLRLLRLRFGVEVLEDPSEADEDGD